MVARRVHNSEVAGSIPSLATSLCPDSSVGRASKSRKGFEGRWFKSSFGSRTELPPISSFGSKPRGVHCRCSVQRLASDSALRWTERSMMARARLTLHADWLLTTAQPQPLDGRQNNLVEAQMRNQYGYDQSAPNAPWIMRDVQNKCGECGLVWVGIQSCLCHQCATKQEKGEAHAISQTHRSTERHSA